MVDTFFAFDTNDSTAGEFYQKCKEDIESFCSKIGIDITFFSNDGLNEEFIYSELKKSETFIFGAYSHGGDNRLVAGEGIPYISTEMDNTCFKNSFFYTYSCHSAKLLGLNLVDNGCRCFIGYNKKIGIWDTYKDFFVKTANYGIKLFFQGKTTVDVLAAMNDEYNRQIDTLYKIDFMAAADLEENRDALVIIGENISIRDLEA